MSTSPSAQASAMDWVLADCPACGKTMKIRSESVGKAAMVCPSCRAPITVEFAAEEEEEAPTLPLGNGASPVMAPSALPPAGGRANRASTEAAAPDISFRPPTLPPPKHREAKRPEPAMEKPAGIPEKRSGAGLPRGAPADNSAQGVVPAETPEAELFRQKLKAIGSDYKLKVKRRRRHGEDHVRLADWDTRDLDHIPEAELAADEWVTAPPDLLPEEVVPQDSRDYVTRVDVVDGKEIRRIKRVQKRKLLRGVQLAFNRMTVTMRWLVLGVVGLIAATGVWLLVRNFGSKAEIGQAEPMKPETPAAAAVREELTIDNLEGAQKRVRDYLAAPNWKEKSKHVRLPDKTAPKMEKWYATHQDGAIVTTEFVTIKKAKLGNSYYIFLAMRVGPEHVMRYFAVEEIRAADGKLSYLVDWETSTGYQPMELYDYRIKQPKEPMEFRVNVKPSAYYNHEFSDPAKWVAFELSYPGDPDFQLIGYVEKASPLASDLQEQLLVEVNLVLSLRYPEKAVSRDQVLITGIAHRSWYYDDPSAAGTPEAK